MLLIDTLAVGGPARVAITLSAGLRARGVDAWVAHLGARGESGSLVAELRDAGVPVLDLALRSLFDPRPTMRLVSFLRRARVHLLHTHNRYGHLIGRPAAAIAGCPIVSTDHWIHDTETGWRSAVRGQLDMLGARAFRGHTVMVSHAQRRVHERLGRLPTTCVETIPNGVDTRAFRPDPAAGARLRAALGLSHAAPVFVNVAMLRPGKGHADLLAALAVVLQRAPAARLLVVGDGVERAPLEARANALGVGGAVRFLGVRSDVTAVLAAADVYVHPSLFEALPTSILEAMAVGLPVVATNVGGVPELVADGRTGLLVPPASAHALAGAMLTLLDPALRTAFGAAGRRWAESEGSAQVWLDRIEALYRRVVRPG